VTGLDWVTYPIPRFKDHGSTFDPIGAYAVLCCDCANGCWRRMRRSVRVQFGIHQFQSPMRRMNPGTRRAR
jgi:hypothetical protein